MMVTSTKFGISVVAVLCIILQVAQAISYEDFLQCMDNAVASEMGNDGLAASKLPAEILQLLKEELYENRVLKDFATTTKDELTKLLIDDVKARKEYYKTNEKIFRTFILKVTAEDLKNYPDDDAELGANDIQFLSVMTRTAVDKIIEETIVQKKAPTDNSWNVFTLVDAFRTVFFYCKYPKEMAPLLTEHMRVEIKEWLDSTATWGVWGFDSDASDASDANENPVPLKLEL